MSLRRLIQRRVQESSQRVLELPLRLAANVVVFAVALRKKLGQVREKKAE